MGDEVQVGRLLSFRQGTTLWEVWRGLTRFVEEKGYFPTQRELAEYAYVSRGSVGNALNMLEAFGVIERRPVGRHGALRKLVRINRGWREGDGEW
jgi:DNA-binding MarR family transcriptional regulator